MRYKAAIFTVGANNPAPVNYVIDQKGIRMAVFICTNTYESKSTLDSIVGKWSWPPSSYRVFYVDDNPDQIGRLCEQVYKAYRWLESLHIKKEEILLDPTAGRKWMSAGAIIIGAYFQLDLGYVDVKYENGQVVPDTMKCVDLPNAYDQTGLIEAEKVIKYFNSYLYEAVEETLKNIRAGSSLLNDFFQGFLKLSEGYRKWDLFEHLTQDSGMLLEDAIKHFERVDREHFFRPLGGLIEIVKKHILLLSELKGQEVPNLLHVIDLIENARRRYEQGRLDDAMARLYRALEALSQYYLAKDFGIDTSNPDYSKFPQMILENLKAEFNGRIPDVIALDNGYKILAIAGHRAGQQVMHRRGKKWENKFSGILEARNNSILAHGWIPIVEDKLNKLMERVENLMRELEPQIVQKYESLFKFPILERELIYG